MVYTIDSLLALQASVYPFRKNGTVSLRSLNGRLRRAGNCEVHGVGTEKPPSGLEPRKKTRRSRRSTRGGRKMNPVIQRTPGPKGSRELRRSRRASTLRQVVADDLNMLRSKKFVHQPSIDGEVRVMRQLVCSRLSRNLPIDLNAKFAVRVRTYYLRFMFRHWALLAQARERTPPPVAVEREFVECPCKRFAREDGLHEPDCSLGYYRVKPVAQQKVVKRPALENPREDRKVGELQRRGAVRVGNNAGKTRKCPGCQQRLVHLPFCRKKDKITLPFYK
jgi:hypothetical protein